MFKFPDWGMNRILYISSRLLLGIKKVSADECCLRPMQMCVASAVNRCHCLNQRSRPWTGRTTAVVSSVDRVTLHWLVKSTTTKQESHCVQTATRSNKTFFLSVIFKKHIQKKKKKNNVFHAAAFYYMSLSSSFQTIIYTMNVFTSRMGLFLIIK